MDSYSTIRNEIVKVGRRLAARELISGSDGNISVRLTEDHIMVTPSGRNKGLLEPLEMVIVDREGSKIKGELEASSELAMHLSVYEARPDVRACVHAHPPYATAFAVAGRELPFDVLPEVVVTVGPIALTEYAPPGTAAVAKSLEVYVNEHNAFLLQNHGLLTVGCDLEEACNRHETVEHCAHILHLADQLGEITSLQAEEVARLSKIRNEAGKRPS
ncbi:MAG: class II aldolase/adducin family protein [bacterium]|nr:class II aldolase/adducin family protein [bacterium]